MKLKNLQEDGWMDFECITKQTFSLYKLIVTGSFYRRYYQKHERVLEEFQCNTKKTEHPYWGSY